MALAAGTRLGAYEVLGSLGAGGMGEVYRGSDPRIGRMVAIKILPAGASRADDRRARFEQEARAIGRLNHANICAVYDVGRQDGVDFIVMELVEGESLASRLQHLSADGAPLAVDEALPIAIQIAEALSAAHEHGVVHRDIKPANVMLCPDGHVKVLDFGLAKLAEPAALPEATTVGPAIAPSVEGTVVGTAEYMSPEQALGRNIDARTDIFSFGALMYRVFAGRPPFRGSTSAQTLDHILHADPPPLSTVNPAVPRELDRVVAKALSKDREHRYASARDLVVDLRELVSPSRAAARTDVARVRTWHRPVVVSAVAVALVAAVVFGARRLGVWPFASGGYSSVAVLPFDIHDSSERTAYIADGLSEELITKLSRLGIVRVVPWLTAQRFRGSKDSVQKLARQMNVEAVITGSIRQAGDRIVITVSLVDASTGLQSWGEDFEESSTDLFAVQRRVALGAATSLGGRLTRDQSQSLAEPASQNAQAYELYLRGHGLRLTSKANNDLAEGLFRKAVELDPSLASAMVGVSETLWNRYYYGWGGDLKTLDESGDFAARARALQPRLASAYEELIRLAWIKGRTEEGLAWGRTMAENRMQDAYSLFARGRAVYFADLNEEAIPFFEKARELDPASAEVTRLLVPAFLFAKREQRAIDTEAGLERQFGPQARTKGYAGMALEALGRTDEAERYLRRALELAPDEFPYAEALGTVLAHRGDIEGARKVWADELRVLDKALATFPDNPRLWTWRATAFGHLGDRPALEAEIRRVLARERSGSLLSNVGRAYAVIGDVDRSVEYLRQSLAAGHTGFYWRHDLRAYGAESLERSSAYRGFLAALDTELARLRAKYVAPPG